MKCANPQCPNRLHYLRGGSLRLLEREGPIENRLHGESSGFPVCRGTTRYFWLCPECSGSLILRRWTQDGLVLEARAQNGSDAPPSWVVPPEPAVAADSILHFPRPVARSA